MPRHARARWSEAEGDPYPELRKLLAPELAELAPEQLDELFESWGGSAEDLESFWSSVKKFGSQAGGVLKNALPGVVQGATTGMALGPWGALAGAVAGGTISAVSGAKAGRGRRGAGARLPAGIAAKVRQAVPARAGLAKGGFPAGALAGLAGGSPAAAQLLQVISRPETLQALLAMALGDAGRRQVPVGDTPVPVGAFPNLVGTLAQEAAAEYHERTAGEAAGTPLYLLDDAGELMVDPADPLERAGALLLRLSETLPEAEAAEDDESDEAWDEAWEAEELELDALWDEMELAAISLDEEA